MAGNISHDLAEDASAYRPSNLRPSQQQHGMKFSDDKYKCPQFDYAFFYLDKDEHEAISFHEEFQIMFGIKGCIYNDGSVFPWIQVGDDMERATAACEYSTFILIYVTPNLCELFDLFSHMENEVFKQLKYAALYNCLTNQDKYDCFVPIFLQPKNKYKKLPFSIAPLAGLVKTSRFYADNVAALFGLTKTENNTYVPNPVSTAQCKKKQRERMLQEEKRKYDMLISDMLNQVNLSDKGKVQKEKKQRNPNHGDRQRTVPEYPSSSELSRLPDSATFEVSSTVLDQPSSSHFTRLPNNATGEVSSTVPDQPSSQFTRLPNNATGEATCTVTEMPNSQFTGLPSNTTGEVPCSSQNNENLQLLQTKTSDEVEIPQSTPFNDSCIEGMTNEQFFNYVAENVQIGVWRQFVMDLPGAAPLTDNIISKIKYDYEKDGIIYVIFKCLLEWEMRNPEVDLVKSVKTAWCRTQGLRQSSGTK